MKRASLPHNFDNENIPHAHSKETVTIASMEIGSCVTCAV